MVVRLAIAGLMMAACVVVHAIGSVGVLRWFARSRAAERRRFWPATGVLIRVAAWFVGMHLVEVTLWATFYAWGHALPDLHVALYFSSVTYTTVGYGDVVLPTPWRLVGGIEALTGILMCGWSAAAYFALVSRMMSPVRSPAGATAERDGRAA